MFVEAVISAFMANVLSDLTINIAKAASRKWQRILKGGEEYQALKDCLYAGWLAISEETRGATTMQRDRLESNFF